MNDRLSIGGNNPPADDRVNTLVQAANMWLSEVKEITDETTAAACEDFLAQVKAEQKAVDDERKQEKKPHDDAAKAVDAKFKPILNKLTMILELLVPRKTAWLKKAQEKIEAERRAKQEEARRAAEEAERTKAAAGDTIEDAIRAKETEEAAKQAQKDAERAGRQKANLRGDFTTRASGLRTYWSAEITDYAKALKHYSGRDEVKELIQRLADADARAAKEELKVPGVTAVSEQRAA